MWANKPWFISLLYPCFITIAGKRNRDGDGKGWQELFLLKFVLRLYDVCAEWHLPYLSTLVALRAPSSRDVFIGNWRMARLNFEDFLRPGYAYKFSREAMYYFTSGTISWQSCRGIYLTATHAAFAHRWIRWPCSWW